MAITGAKTDLFENLILNYVFKGEATFETGAALYIGLVTGAALTYVDEGAATGPANWQDHEVAASRGYARQTLGDSVFSAAATAGTITNGAEINFGTSTHTDGWGSVTGFIITTGSAIASTGTYYYGLFDVAKSVATGDSVRITASNLTIEER